MKAPNNSIVLIGNKSGKTFGFGLQIIIAMVCKTIEIPIAVINGANLGAFLRGRYATLSIVTASNAQAGTAESKAKKSNKYPGMPGKIISRNVITDRATIAPNISTSP
jgi:hypothetical protein